MHSNQQIVDRKVSGQNSRYCITRLVLGKNSRNTKVLSTGILSLWDSFVTRHPMVYQPSIEIIGSSHCVSAACSIVATEYKNSIVQNFE